MGEGPGFCIDGGDDFLGEGAIEVAVALRIQ